MTNNPDGIVYTVPNSEIWERVKKALNEEGIEIPWPHAKVFFGNTPPAPAATMKQKE